MESSQDAIQEHFLEHTGSESCGHRLLREEFENGQDYHALHDTILEKPNAEWSKN